MASNGSPVNLGQLVDNVREDPSLKPEEKEYTIIGTKAEDKVQVYSEVAGMMRRLLVHPEFTLLDVRALEGNRLKLGEYNGETITGVRGRMPVGCLKVRESSRSTSSPTEVISWRRSQNEASNPEDIEDQDANNGLKADDD